MQVGLQNIYRFDYGYADFFIPNRKIQKIYKFNHF
jgi:hypothetical protein